MLKFRPLLVLSILLAALIPSAHAQSWYVSGEQATELSAGVNYVICPDHAYVTSTVYMAGLGDESTVTNDCIYQLEAVGTDKSGTPTYRILQTSTGLYYATPTSVTTAQTASKASAGVFTIKPSVALVNSDWYAVDWDNVDYTTYIWVSDIYYYHENTFVICQADFDTNNTDYIRLCYYNGINNGLYDGTNTWSFYTVEKAGAFDDLYLYLEENYPNGVQESNYVIGTTIGCVSQESVDNLKAAYAAARALADGEQATDDEYLAALTALQEAEEAIENSLVMPTAPAYYVLTNAESSRGNGNATMYDLNGKLQWQEFSIPQGNFSTEDAQNVWQLLPAGESNSDGFYLKNFVTQRYAGSQSSLYTVVPTTEEMSQVYYLSSYSMGTPTFYVYTKDQNVTYPALHAQSDGTNIVIWTNSATASAWTFTEISEDVLQEAQAGIEQLLLNNELQELYEESTEATKLGVVLTSAATADGEYADLGLVTDTTQISTNKEEPTVGGIEYLLDNNQRTYFASTWSVENTDGAYAYLDVDLGKSCQYVVLKYSSAWYDGSYVPTTVRFYGTNEEGEAAVWTLQETGTLTYEYPSNSTYSATYDNFTGLYSLVMNEPYRYLRMEVIGTVDDATYNDNLYFYLSEFHVYEGAYDANNSPLEGMDATVRANFESARAAAKVQVESGTATREVIDNLQAAYDAYIAALPDPDVATEALEEANELLSTAVEGSETGYFESGSKAEFEAAINAISPSIKTVMTLAEIDDVTTRLEAAINAFMDRLIKPSEGVYYIMSATTNTSSGTPVNNYLYAADNDNSRVLYGGYSSETGRDENLDARLNYMWRLSQQEDGTYTLRNIGTGTYMGNCSASGYYLLMSQEPQSIDIHTAKSAGLLSLLIGDGLYANALQSYTNVTSVSSVGVADNTAFSFVVASPEGSDCHDLDEEPVIYSLPYAIVADCGEANFYKVVGVKTDDSGQYMVFQQYGETESIPAATAFLMVPEEGSTTAFFYPEDEVLELNYSFEEQIQNGLVATLQSREVPANSGLLFKSDADYVILATQSGDTSSANSGYFNGTTTSTEESGDLQLAIDGVITRIGKVTTLSASENVNVYTLSGVKVRGNVKETEAVKNLPSGLYIVGNKKVYIK